MIKGRLVFDPLAVGDWVRKNQEYAWFGGRGRPRLRVKREGKAATVEFGVIGKTPGLTIRFEQHQARRLATHIFCAVVGMTAVQIQQDDQRCPTNGRLLIESTAFVASQDACVGINVASRVDRGIPVVEIVTVQRIYGDDQGVDTICTFTCSLGEAAALRHALATAVR